MISFTMHWLLNWFGSHPRQVQNLPHLRAARSQKSWPVTALKVLVGIIGASNGKKSLRRYKSVIFPLLNSAFFYYSLEVNEPLTE